MKRIGMILGVLMVTASMGYAATRMSVQVRTGQLRERPSFLGSVVTDVAYGDRVTVERDQGPWRYVTHGEQAGWIHESALTRQRVVLAAGDEDVGGAASTEELALAGKGFNAEVEGEFKRQNADIDFSWVDRMEKMGVEAARLTRFLKEGGVKPAGDQQ